MAIARLMSEGWDERASFSAEGSGLSLNFLSSALPYLFNPAYIGFRSF